MAKFGGKNVGGSGRLALATLGGVTQIGSFLFQSIGKESKTFSSTNFANVNEPLRLVYTTAIIVPS